MLSRRIAFIDLDNAVVIKEDIPLEWRRKYLGARGINMYLLYSLLGPNCDPLGPENPLIFGSGLLTGVAGFGCARCNISALSPESGNIGDSNIGGGFGGELKYTGFDHLVIGGKSNAPVYILINNDDIQIRDARHLWGKDTWETQEAIKKENNDDRIKVAAIGVAGENLVSMANVMTGQKDAAGRFGMGAVMGSKKVKAVAVRGTKDVEPAHPKELLAYFKEQMDMLMSRKWTQAFKRFGTLQLTVFVNENNLSLPRNEQGEPLGERARGLYPEAIERYALGSSSCLGCAVHCRHRYLVKEGPYAGTRCEGPDFGTVLAYGFNPEITDFEFPLYCNQLCNRLGLDVISAGWMSAYAIDLYQKGIVGKDVTGRELMWGDPDSMLAMTNAIAHREGFGDILADGPASLNRLPAEAGKYMPRVRNNRTDELGARIYPVYALSRAVSTLPGHIHRNHAAIALMKLPAEVLQELYGSYVSPDPTSTEGKAVQLQWHERLNAVCDALGFCRFQSAVNSPRAPKFEEYREFIRLAAGLDMTVPEVIEIGERILTTERLLFGKLGIGSRKDDALPESWFSEPIAHGPAKGAVADREAFENLLNEYYALHGWDENGVPTAESVDRLGIAEAQLVIKGRRVE